MMLGLCQNLQNYRHRVNPHVCCGLHVVICINVGSTVVGNELH